MPKYIVSTKEAKTGYTWIAHGSHACITTTGIYASRKLAWEAFRRFAKDISANSYCKAPNTMFTKGEKK